MKTPDDRPRQARKNSSGKQSGEGGARRIGPLLTNLVNGAENKPASRQPTINGVDAEGKRLAIGLTTRAHAPELLAKRGQGWGMGGGKLHDVTGLD